jgi:hypothetical protein
MTADKDFPMPFLMSPEAAARRVADGMASSGFEIAFPRRLVWLSKLTRVLPYALYFPLLTRAMAQGRRER